MKDPKSKPRQSSPATPKPGATSNHDTERHSAHGAELQREKAKRCPTGEPPDDTERHSNSGDSGDGVTQATEKLSNGATHVTQGTQDIPKLSVKIFTINDAIGYSMEGKKIMSTRTFDFCRALKAFEVTNRLTIPRDELGQHFLQWWSKAKELGFIPKDTPEDPNPEFEFDEWRLDFFDTFQRTRTALGANPVDEAIRRAKLFPRPPGVKQYASPRLDKLVLVCWHLQQLNGEDPFFLSARTAAKIMGVNNPTQANTMLNGLVLDNVLDLVEKGFRGQTRDDDRASRFRFIQPEN